MHKPTFPKRQPSFIFYLAFVATILLVSRATKITAQSADQKTIIEAGIQVKEATWFLQKDSGNLWGTRLDRIPWFLIVGQRVFLSADPKLPAYKPLDGFWTGPLPAELMPSNTL